MTNPNFDWIMLLPEEERKAVLARRDANNEAFVKGFPVRSLEAAQDAAELHQAGVEGRAAFAKACATMDARKETERLLNAVTDHIAGTLQQPADPRAWEQLLIYCPQDILERRTLALAQAEQFRQSNSTSLNPGAKSQGPESSGKPIGGSE